jgi:hypothetical protein
LAHFQLQKLEEAYHNKGVEGLLRSLLLGLVSGIHGTDSRSSNLSDSSLLRQASKPNFFPVPYIDSRPESLVTFQKQTSRNGTVVHTMREEHINPDEELASSSTGSPARFNQSV